MRYCGFRNTDCGIPDGVLLNAMPFALCAKRFSGQDPTYKREKLSKVLSFGLRLYGEAVAA
jgi:hypothetical protein